jgi:precorrin-6B methylase 2
MKIHPGLLLICAAALLAGPALLPAQDVPYVPTPPEVVERMLALAEVRKGDVVYDLGCGDGRIVVAAARIPGVQAVCVESDPRLIEEGRKSAAAQGVGDRVRFVQGDLFEAPLHEATVVTLYLLQSVNLRLRPRLLSELKPGTRIVSHTFDMGDWEPQERVVVNMPLREHVIYRWVVPPRSPAGHAPASAPCPAGDPTRCATTPRSSP